MFQKRYTLLFLLLFTGYLTKAQEVLSVRNDVSQLDTLAPASSRERLYLHLDRPRYATGDTLWFKVYLFDPSLNASEKSGIFYLELADRNNKLVRRMKFPLAYGLGWGNIALDEKDFPEGGYTLRAYTNWMRNFGQQALFSREIHIHSPTPESWLLGTRLSGGGEKGKGRLSLGFSRLDKKPLGLKELDLQVMDGKKLLYKSRLETSADGTLELEFPLPLKAGNLSLSVQEPGKNGRAIEVPLPLDRPENTDLQFMPEGGHLVAGLETLVAFKAISEEGLGTEAKGKITNEKGIEVARFHAEHKGMGAFVLAPEAGGHYTAELELPDGTVKAYPLPEVRPSGTAMAINGIQENDSLEIRISATPDLRGTGKGYYLTAKSGGAVRYSQKLDFKTGTTAIVLCKKLFPSRIALFTLSDSEYGPLNERAVFIDHGDGLDIDIATQGITYKSRDSIALDIRVRDKNGMPVQGSFSLSVSDDARTGQPETAHNLLSYLLLGSELKGNIEDPNYYGKRTEAAKLALDRLLLTQGWGAYHWPEPEVPEHPAERDFSIRGTTGSLIGKTSKAGVTLYSQKPLVYRDTLTDEEGRFEFRDLPVTDSAAYMVQSRRRNGASFGVGIKIEEQGYPVFAPPTGRYLPWFVNGDSALLKNMGTAVREQKGSMETGYVLEDVNITGTMQVYSEQELQKEGRISLYDFLFKNIKDLRVGSVPGPVRARPNTMMFYIGSGKANFSMDYISLDQFYRPSSPPHASEYLTYIKNWLEYYSVQDVTEIKIRGSSAMITTRAGKGPIMNEPGVNVYRPFPQFSFPRQFYRPRYVLKDSVENDDLRSTIHWEPSIITDAEGKATISFYAADGPSTYTVVMEGSDMEGKVGNIVKEAFLKIEEKD